MIQKIEINAANKKIIEALKENEIIGDFLEDTESNRYKVRRKSLYKSELPDELL